MKAKNKLDNLPTPQPEVCLTRHADQRLKQRHFSLTQLAYVVENGQMLHRTGIVFYFLGLKDVPLSDRNLKWVQQLIGVTILVSAQTGTIITIYCNKNRTALQNIKKKTKFRATRQVGSAKCETAFSFQ